MSAFDSYLQKRTWKAYVLVCVCSFGLCATGGFGLITGVPAMIFISLLMCLSLYRTFAMTITSWLKLLSGLVVGLILDMAFAIPGMAAMDISVNVKESFKNAKMTYKLFDLIRGSYFLRSGSISSVGIPVFYVGILTLVAVAAFALNEQIPVRIKVCAVAVLTVIHVTCSSSFVNETVSVFGIAPVVNSSTHFNNQCAAPALKMDENTRYLDELESLFDEGELIDGVCGKALKLDDGQVAPLGVNLIDSMSVGTVEFWFRPNEDFYDKKARTLIGNDGARIHFFYKNGEIYFQKNHHNQHFFVKGAVELKDDWNLIAGQWGDGYMSVWVNGELVDRWEHTKGYVPASRG